MNYEQLVKALRCKSLSKQCDSCKYGYRLCQDSECNDACHVEQIYADAAAAIEALQAKNKELHERIEDEELKIDMLTADNTNYEIAIDELKAQLPKRGEWLNSKERMRPDMCSVCGCVYEADRFMDKIAWNYCPRCGAKMEVQDGKE